VLTAFALRAIDVFPILAVKRARLGPPPTVCG